VLVLACKADGGSFCGGNTAPVRVEQMVPADENAAARALPIIGERVVVRDGALGTSWRAVEAGTAGLRASTSDDFDPAAKEPFRYLFALDAEREDTKERRRIEVAVTFVPADDGVRPVAIELESVDRDATAGGPTQTRTFWACPHGGKLHYSRWAKGQSPCHRETLVPIVLCGCDDSVEHIDANDCKDSRTALKKSACARDDGLPIPPP
jgi:hypothetical protein